MINIPKMKLKRTNPNGDIVLRSIINHVKLCVWKIVKFAFRIESYKLFFQEDALIA